MTEPKKTVLVTGANRGIGLAISKQLSEKDFYVFLGCRDVQACTDIILREEMNPDHCIPILIDMDIPDSMDRAIGHILNTVGRIDALINNAGVLYDEDKAGLYVSKEIVTNTMETNAIGPLLLMQKVIPIMQDNKYGRIVNISTDMSLIRSMYAERLAYRISKSALNVITKVLATEVADDNILINVMSPGWVRTDMGGTNAPRRPEEAADTAVYLATLPENGPSGCFFKDRKIVPW